MPVAARDDLYTTHAQALRALQAGGPSWLIAARETALEQYRAEGLPSTREEEWRFTNVASLVEAPFVSAADAEAAAGRDLVAPFDFEELEAITVLVVNGRALAPEPGPTLPPGVVVSTLGGALGAHPDLVRAHLGRALSFVQQGFTALNTASFLDGLFVHVPDGVLLDRPVHVLHLGGVGPPAASHPRTLVVAEPGSALTVVESYGGAAGSRYFTNALSEVLVAADATVTHYRVQRESLAATHVSSTHVRLGDRARFSSENLVLGGAVVRNDVNAVLDGEHVVCTLNGLYLADGRRLVDNHTAIDHARPHGESHELYKGILDEHGRGVFNGKIFVRQDAQKTDAKQTNQALLLSDDATINTKPQLEIFADDVKCTHGATVGQLDEEALFYLRSRGIEREAARSMLIHAFALDVIERIELVPVRAELERDLLMRLHA